LHTYADSAPQSRRPRVLIVEDEPSIRMLIRRSLSADFEVVDASDADMALEAAADDTFDLFVLDIHLGDSMNGVSLLHALRSRKQHATTPGLACTAFSDPSDRAMLLSSGFEAFVAKPFLKHELVESAQAIIRIKSAA
jgi:DNA-binding response OmpR family regulator